MSTFIHQFELEFQTLPWYFKILVCVIGCIAFSYCFATLAMPWRIGHIKDGVDEIKKDVNQIKGDVNQIESKVREIQDKLKDLERPK